MATVPQNIWWDYGVCVFTMHVEGLGSRSMYNPLRATAPKVFYGWLACVVSCCRFMACMYVHVNSWGLGSCSMYVV